MIAALILFYVTNTSYVIIKFEIREAPFTPSINFEFEFLKDGSAPNIHTTPSKGIFCLKHMGQLDITDITVLFYVITAAK